MLFGGLLLLGGKTLQPAAAAAEVSEVTVFNYFPTKEDLFYGGMQFFEEQLIDAVRNRARGESALGPFRRRLLEGADRLATKETVDAIRKAAKASPALRQMMPSRSVQPRH